MADIRIGVRVSFRGRALKVLGVSPLSEEPRRVFLEDEETGERFVISTRVLGVRESSEAGRVSISYEAS
jgi:hypothetical protein